jgi:hypothetical protein
MRPNPSVEQKILSCIDEALRALGEDGRQALQKYFHKDVHLERDRIVEEPELFRKRLNQVLGQRSARALEAWIVRNLASSFELKTKPKMTLTEAIRLIKAAAKESGEKGT